MEIIPVIYILDGRTVALYKGSIEQTEVYSTSPIEYAKKFVAEGATEIYLVDLDASEYGSDKNLVLIKELRKAVDVSLMCAGGIRTIGKVDQIFDMGINKVILGVAAEGIYKESIEKYGADKVIIGIKAKGDEVLTDIERDFPLRVIELAEKLPDYGVKYVLFKDMWKESTMVGPNYDEIDRIISMTPIEVYASGGIGKEKHLDTLKDIGVKAAIIGKAFYEKELYLKNLIGNY